MEVAAAPRYNSVELAVWNLYRWVGNAGEVWTSRGSWTVNEYGPWLLARHNGRLLAVNRRVTTFDQPGNLR